jgi:hypothetical protein
MDRVVIARQLDEAGDVFGLDDALECGSVADRKVMEAAGWRHAGVLPPSLSTNGIQDRCDTAA